MEKPVIKQYSEYVDALRQEAPPMTSTPNTMYNTNLNVTPTGFLEFQPRDMNTQKKYDALSPHWEGVASSEAAVARGDYSLDSAETTRRELREKIPPRQPPTPQTPSLVERIKAWFK